MKSLAIALTLFLSINFSMSLEISAQNISRSCGTVSGTISNDTVWSTDTIDVVGDIIIPDTVSLSINPGTVVLFHGAFGIDVQGVLQANGTPGDSIIFSAADTTGYADSTFTGWTGIHFKMPSTSNTSEISYCIFEYAKADTAINAAVFINDFSLLTISHCRFSDNFSAQAGSCIQINNESSVYVHDNVFTNNRSFTGCVQFGMSLSGDTVDAVIERNIFHNNIGTDGPGLIMGGYCAAHVINNVFIDNFCTANGGAVTITDHCSPVLFGNLFSGNESMGNGGAIVVKSTSRPKMINNTIVKNKSLFGAGIWMSCSAMNVVVQNNILWGNSASVSGNQMYLRSEGSTYSIINNLLEDGTDSIFFEVTYTGTMQNNYAFSPEFADFSGNDFHLTCPSQAINAGSFPVASFPASDMDGNPRLNGSEYDLGAFESNAAATVISQPQNFIAQNGDIATFEVDAAGAFGYQWEVSSDLASSWTSLSNDSVYSGTTTSQLIIQTNPSLNGYLYRCNISGICPEVTTTTLPAILLVSNPDGLDERTSDVIVYPVPAHDFVTIVNASGSQVIITNFAGQVVADYPVLKSNTEEISVLQFDAGLYFITVTSNNFHSTMKMIVE